MKRISNTGFWLRLFLGSKLLPTQTLFSNQALYVQHTNALKSVTNTAHCGGKVTARMKSSLLVSTRRQHAQVPSGAAI